MKNLKTQSTKEKANAELADEVLRDFEKRKLARKAFELQWQLNIDFFHGRQNNYISKFETVVPLGKQYYWQEREIFNHIGPMVEARLAKLSEHRAVMGVTPSTNDPSDIECADTCEKIVKGAFQRLGFGALTEQANMWSELCGTAFYKVLWNNAGGRMVGELDGKAVYEGDAAVVVCSPFEIYPDNITASDISELRSIIHAKAYKTAQIAEIWGVTVQGMDIDTFDLTTAGAGKKGAKTTMSDAAVVIERYEMPSLAHTNGRLVIVAGGKVLFCGDLPYINQSGGKRGLPFVRQCSEQAAGCFWGQSVIERAIPVQRAYNSVKNRKTEFLNRLACGVMSVEEGSTDLESLESDGLSPGKVIVYRQGTQAPKFIDAGSMPAELEREEERLLSEFTSITGSVDIARDAGFANMSGIALQILVEQDNKSMSRVIKSILRSAALVGAQLLRLYKQFAENGRLERVVNGGEVEMFYWNSAEITSDEVTAESASEVADTPSAKRLLIVELLKVGLLHSEDGKISNETREKILGLIGLEELI